MNKFDDLCAHFSEVEAANLTLVLTTINALNRLAIAIGALSGNLESSCVTVEIA